MTSNVRKGNDFENKCKNLLIEEGYFVMKAQRTMRSIPGRFVCQSNDFFGLFDLIAKKGSVTRWIQCKYGSKNIYNDREAFNNFKNHYTSNYESVEIWFQPKGKSIQVFEVTGL